MAALTLVLQGVENPSSWGEGPLFSLLLGLVLAVQVRTNGFAYHLLVDSLVLSSSPPHIAALCTPPGPALLTVEGLLLGL